MNHKRVDHILFRIMRLIIRFGLLMLCVATFSSANDQAAKRCLIVASYHDEFPGQKLKVQGALKVLEGKCEIKQFNMDTKRNPAPEFCKKKALEAKALIESWRPDVVIAIEDNASKYLVKPYYKNAKIPFVFSGVDWTAKSYGYPYKNATGMIEVALIQQLFKQLLRINPNTRRGVFIRPDRLSATKNYARFNRVAASKGINVGDGVVRTMDDFEKTYLAAQSADFIIFTNNAAIEGWEDARAKQFIFDHAKKLVVTQSDWMIPFAMLAINKVIEEQGEYAAEVALKILDGASPADFPIIANRKWNIYVNEPLLKQAGIIIPGDLLRKAEKFK
jgi:ABC-type uncharacterized transport system substrate-binding protein